MTTLSNIPQIKANEGSRQHSGSGSDTIASGHHNGPNNNSGKVWDDEMGATSDQLFFVTSYSDFDKLAHCPRGTAATSHPLYVYRFHPNDGSLVLLNIHGDDSSYETKNTLINPAFSRHHPYLNVVYTCTEDCHENGKVLCYSIGPNGELSRLGDAVDAGGTSTCYLTVDKDAKHLLCVNYWDSTLTVVPLDTATGQFMGPVQHTYDPKQGQRVAAPLRCAGGGGVNHSNNDASTIRMRQADPHSHALVLDPFVGCIAYVPDLGKDLIREFIYVDGKIVLEMNILPSGLCTGHPDGPRYLEFHPQYNTVYVINELSSTIAVFQVDKALLHEIAATAASDEEPTLENMMKFKGRSTLRLIQSIKTLPSAFPTLLNTCGRICVHKSGRFVVVSNRGHQSIAVFRVVKQKSNNKKKTNSLTDPTGRLVAVGYFHTRGETPRHFQFDASGQYLLVANQDTDSLAVFNFNLSSGVITYTGNEYRVPSPNFVCSCPRHDDMDDTDDVERDAISSAVGLQLSQQVVSNLQIVDSTAVDGETTAPLSSNSSSSYVPIPNKDTPKNLADELVDARREIALLREQLQLIQQQQNQPTPLE